MLKFLLVYNRLVISPSVLAQEEDIGGQSAQVVVDKSSDYTYLAYLSELDPMYYFL